MHQLTYIPKDASDDDVIAIIRRWVDVLASEDYDLIGSELGYGLAFGEPIAACIQQAVQGYRSPILYPGVDQFAVTDWRIAEGGNPAPKCLITWYKPNGTGLAGAVEFDLPLNGRWSDLTADFVWFASDDPNGRFRLGLEEISSCEQSQRDADVDS